MPNPTTSRRVVLATLAGAAVHASGFLRGAGLQERTLVCIRVADNADTTAILSSPSATGTLPVTSSISQLQFGMNQSLPGLRLLFEQGAVALIQEASSTAGRDYVHGGYSAPAWMTGAVGVSVTSSAGRAFPFSSGLLMLQKHSSASAAGTPPAAFQGLDDPTLIAEAGRGNFSFPDTSLGRQLRQVAGLLASGAGGKLFVASIGGPVTVGDADQQRSGRLAQLDAALSAFHGALGQIGAGSDVVTFTDSDLTAPQPGVRLLMGGSVIGSEVYATTPQEDAGAALAAWGGYRFAGGAVPAAQFLY